MGAGYPERRTQVHLAGEGEDWGKRLPGSGDARARCLCTRRMPPKDNETKNQNMTRNDNSHREGDRRGHRDAEGPTADDPPGD